MNRHEIDPHPSSEPTSPSARRDAEALPPDELNFWSDSYAAQAGGEEQSGSPYLLFRLGSERFALLMAELDEVASFSRGVVLPHTSPLVQGLANLRGEPVLLMDLTYALGADANPRFGRDNRTLVIKDCNGRRTGLMVDALDGVVALDPGLFDVNVLKPGSDLPVRRAGSAEFQGGTLFLVDTAPLREARLNHF